MTVLLVEFGKLVEIVVVDAVAAFDRVEFLSTGAKVEFLNVTSCQYVLTPLNVQYV